MPPLPVVSGRELVRILERFGWAIARQRGSHVILTKPGSLATLSVPDHDEVGRGTPRSLLRAADVTPSEFLRVFRA